MVLPVTALAFMKGPFAVSLQTVFGKGDRDSSTQGNSVENCPGRPVLGGQAGPIQYLDYRYT